MGAGTDANVFINIYGTKGETGKIQLESSSTNKNPFEKGKLDIFQSKSRNVGEIKKINISHDGKGTGAGWFCEKVVIKHAEITKTFKIGRWLDESEEDGKISIDVQPEVTSENNPKVESKNLQQNKNESPRKKNDNSSNQKDLNKKESVKTDYKFQIKTASDISSGIDANVFISLFGNEGELVDLEMKSKTKDKNTFERGKIDTFDLSGLNSVGKLKKISIGHDSPNSAWKLDYVNIIFNNTLYKFIANKWLDGDLKKSNEKLTSIELEPTSIIESNSFSILFK